MHGNPSNFETSTKRWAFTDREMLVPRIERLMTGQTTSPFSQNNESSRRFASYPDQDRLDAPVRPSKINEDHGGSARRARSEFPIVREADKNDRCG